MELEASLQNQQLQTEATLQEIRAREITETEEQKTQPEINAPAQKMGTTLFFILLLLCIFGDLIEIFTVGTIGWLTGLAIDGILLLSIGVTKNAKKQFKRILVGVIGETVPIINILPLRSVFLVWAYVKSGKN